MRPFYLWRGSGRMNIRKVPSRERKIKVLGTVFI